MGSDGGAREGAGGGAQGAAGASGDERRAAGSPGALNDDSPASGAPDLPDDEGRAPGAPEPSAHDGGPGTPDPSAHDGREPSALDALADELSARFRAGPDAWAGGAFEETALRVFRFQFEHNAPYRGFCRGRGADPDTVEGWEDIPPVPATAFKRIPLVSGDPGREPERLFRTSGTTAAGGRRGEHRVPRMDVYRASAVPTFAAHLLPDGVRLPLVCLLPSPRVAPDSSLSAMAGFVAEDLAAPGGGWFVDEGGLRVPELSGALEAAEAGREPVLVLGTAFSLVHALDALAAGGRRIRLPDGSRVMETGGFKGRSRELPREELYAAVEDRLGVPTCRVVNEYGMTELLSQFYEPVLAEGTDPGLSRSRHVAPPWLRTRILDPVTLDPVPPGEPGLLCHVDLANVGSVCAVLTEDVGVEARGGIRVRGRVEGSEPRGCSRAMDELLAAAGKTG